MLIVAWLLSVAAAVLFFSSGVLFHLRHVALGNVHADRTHHGDESSLAPLSSGAHLVAEMSTAASLSLPDASRLATFAPPGIGHTAPIAGGANPKQSVPPIPERGSDSLAPPAKEAAARRSEAPPQSAGAEVFQAILDRETRGNSFAGAVITDALGLVVAATGEYSDALAAYGAFLAGIGGKTRNELPLDELRSVIVQDNRDTTLTVRPLAFVEDSFALVTLAAGHSSGNQGTSPSMER